MTRIAAVIKFELGGHGPSADLDVILALSKRATMYMSTAHECIAEKWEFMTDDPDAVQRVLDQCPVCIFHMRTLGDY
jgi:hypothetical protein